MKFLITGGKGALAQDVARLLAQSGDEVVAVDRDRLDITNQEQVASFVQQTAPDAIINCAANNAVDKIEDPEIFPLAYAVNALGPKHLAQAALVQRIPFVHVSTDCVFNGEKREGYVETDVTHPISRYGETKEAAEKLVQEVGGQYYLARTTRLFGRPGASDQAKESFVSLILKLAATKPELSIVDEEVGCPTYTPDLAAALMALIKEKYPVGIYHLVNDGPGVTWYQFAQDIFALKNVTTPFKPVTSAEFPKPAKRPQYSILLNTKFPKLRAREEALKEFLNGSI